MQMELSTVHTSLAGSVSDASEFTLERPDREPWLLVGSHEVLDGVQARLVGPQLHLLAEVHLRRLHAARGRPAHSPPRPSPLLALVL